MKFLSLVLDAIGSYDGELLEYAGIYSEIDYDNGIFSTEHPDWPVVQVTWRGAAAYCDWMNMQVGLPPAYDHNSWRILEDSPYDASGYRLPTEAEWEFAARAGTTTHFNTGDCLDSGTEANFRGLFPYTGCAEGPYLMRAADVGSYPPNDWGLFDMHGNVYEWCNDRYGSYGGDETDPAGALSAWSVLRSGGWTSEAERCRSAHRSHLYDDVASFDIGFRTVRTIH